MLAALVVLLRTLGLLWSGHRAIALENVALRQQLSIFRRTVRRPHLRTSDRVLWVLLATAWPDWRTALIVVQPDTVVRWHRDWLRRRWTRSTRTCPGRPSTTAAIRTLVDQMTEANPLWGAPRIHGELGKVGIAVSERTVSHP
jgi:putative transposase